MSIEKCRATKTITRNTSYQQRTRFRITLKHMLRNILTSIACHHVLKTHAEVRFLDRKGFLNQDQKHFENIPFNSNKWLQASHSYMSKQTQFWGFMEVLPLLWDMTGKEGKYIWNVAEWQSESATGPLQSLICYKIQSYKSSWSYVNRDKWIESFKYNSQMFSK